MNEAAPLGATLSTVVFLAAAVAAVPLFRFAGLSAVLGYLAAGLVIGPSGLGLFQAPEVLRSIAELGIVMFLFVIGLELKPSKLISMRKDIVGLGLAQLLLTMLFLIPFVGLVLPFGAGLLVTAFAFALSATAIALQILDERGAMATTYGQKTFAILLFQDMAIVPFIALMPFLRGFPAGAEAELMAHLPDVAMAFGALAALILAGRYLLNPFFRMLARADAREVMTAAALLVVLGAAEAMHAVGLSAALGAFVAGLLLAESHFRHQLEADIEPFRGLLLGLFFMSVGMGLEAQAISANLALVIGGALAILAVKAVIAYLMLRAQRLGMVEAARAAVLLSTVGEFSFVIVPLGAQFGLFPAKLASLLAAIAALTMFFGPLLAKLLEVLVARRAARASETEEPNAAGDFDGATGDVLVIGFGRFGQVVNQMFLAVDRDVTVIDRNIDRVKAAGTFGFKVYYGDGRRLDVLRAAGAERAAVIAVCIEDKEATSAIVEMVRRTFPNARLFVRAYDRVHALDLMERGVKAPVRETFESALHLGREALIGLGHSEDDAEEVRLDVRRRDIQRLQRQREEGMFAGQDLLHGVTVAPAPLKEPKRKARPIATAKPAAEPDYEGVTGASS